MARITVTIPEDIHQTILQIAKEENNSVSHTVAHLVEIGIMVIKSKHENSRPDDLEEYCQKLIIQMNGILKELVVDKFNFGQEKITAITNDTLNQFKRLKG